MTNHEKLRRLGLDKIALLLLLAAGLFLAKLVISSRSNFKLSEPVILQGSGLAVSVPTGRGFTQPLEGFQYDDNEFRLISVLQINNNTAISISWRYFLLPPEETAFERFHTQAADIKGSIEKTGSELFGQFTFDYAEIFSAKKPALLFSGTTLLPDGRTLSLEVMQKGLSADLAEKIFKTTIASATYTPDNPMAKGKELLDNFRRNTLADMLQKQAEQNYYYIKNYTGQTLGFTTDTASVKNDVLQANSLVAANLYFFKSGINAFAEQTVFHSKPNLQTFKWASLQRDFLTNRKLTTSIELNSQGTISVHKRDTVQNFTFTPTMLPEIFLDTFIKSFLQSSFDSVMVDLILSDGRIRPVIITRAEPQKAASAVKAAFFGTSVTYQTIYLDSNGNTLASEVQGRISYKLQRAQKEDIIADFPQWADKIEQIEKTFQEESEKSEL
jgi:hypothetical protein